MAATTSVRDRILMFMHTATAPTCLRLYLLMYEQTILVQSGPTMI